MKIGIYNQPCGSAIGGGEVSVAVLAEALAKNHEVEILHHHSGMTLERWSQFAGVDLHNVKLRVSAPPASKLRGYLTERRAEAELSKAYDLFIAFTHFVPPYCAAPHSAHMVLFPFSDLQTDSLQPVKNSFSWIPRPLLSLWRRWKWQSNLASYQTRMANSDFTRRWTKKRWNVDCQVVFPPVNIDVPPGEKTNHILSVGRFAVSAHCKKQMEMLQMFDRLKTAGHTDWQYDCAGGCGTSDAELAFLEKANQLGAKCGASILANVSHAQLKNLYVKTKIFWHATGMGEDENLHPELTEHFGMTTVEAMAAGCVPVVINKGGQPEIVEHGVSGFLWNTPEEWQQYTVRLMQDDALFQKMSRAARERARRFSREAYVQRIHSLLAPSLHP
jgi:glycosyltransferase involved in cell wall biosynthesis